MQQRDSSACQRARVLIVDDEQLVLETLRRILRKEHDLVISTSATEAVASILGGARYDVFLCDMMMPRLTGMDVHATLARYCPEQAERMAFVTGGATRSDLEIFLQRMSVPCLYKPFSVDSVLELVRTLMGRTLPPSSRSAT